MIGYDASKSTIDIFAKHDVLNKIPDKILDELIKNGYIREKYHSGHGYSYYTTAKGNELLKNK